MNLFLGKSSEKHLKCEKYDKKKSPGFAWDFVYSLKAFVNFYLQMPSFASKFKNQRKETSMIDKRKRNILLLFIVPALIFYLIFWISPVLMSFYYGLTNWRGMGDFDMVGMKNYVNLIQQGTLFDSMGNTIKYTLFVVVWGNVQALVLAFILNMKLRARGAFRTIFYIPALFSTIVVAFLWSYVYSLIME